MVKGLWCMLVQWLFPNLMAFVLHVHGNNIIISWRPIFVHCRNFHTCSCTCTWTLIEQCDNNLLLYEMFPLGMTYPLPCHKRWVHYSPIGSFFVWSHLWFDETVQCRTDKRHTPPPISITSYPPTTDTLSYMGHPLLILMIRSWRNDPWLLSFNFTDVSTTEWWNTCTCMLTKISFSTAPAICSHRLDDFTDWTVVYTNLV